MALTSGARLGVYEITAPIGEGGMGQVWRATDTTLGRQVAIKILPDAFATDPERAARFEREAKTLAALNHPHIAAIYGFEKSSPSTGSGQAGMHALVMELVEGEDLSQRIARGAIPIDEALPIAKQIAEALEAAHEQGIVHRDLKPANVKVRPDGTVKVLDFGLAKAMDQGSGNRDQGSGNAANSPTIMSIAGTSAGMILGTAAYMSPEQAKGRPVDKRTDIFAFGSVLFEMLTGRPAFDGDDVAEILSRVLQKEPNWTLLPTATPAGVRRLLALCLEKDRNRRRRDAGDILIDIDHALAEPATPAATAPGSVTKTAIPWMVSAVLAIGFASLAAMHFGERPAAPLAEMRLDIATPPTSAPLSFALSPDGQSITFVATESGESRLWVRRLDQAEAHSLKGTEGAGSPFWSPDSKSIAFFVSGQLKRVEVSGGSVINLSNIASTGNGGTWNSDGVIVFPDSGSGKLRMPASGGQAVQIPGAEGIRLRWPEFLPDGRHLLFRGLFGGTITDGLYLGSLDGAVPKLLIPSETGAKWLAPDRVVYVPAGQRRLVAQRLDLDRGELVGEPETVADMVSTGFSFQPSFSASSDGRIAYRSGDSAENEFVWMDRSGKVIGKVNAEPGYAIAPALSPDGKRLAVDRTVQSNRDVWLIDLSRGGITRLTFDPATEGFPVWSADGTQIVLESSRKGSFDIYVKSANGAGTEQPLLELPGNQWPMDASRDGKFLLYYDGASAGDLMALPLTGDRKPIPVATTPFTERTGAFSPNGRWVAYDTNESGRSEVVVQPFPNATGKWQVSTAGGAYPRWSADGKELYFVSAGKLMMSSVRDSTSFEASTPIPLFQARFSIDSAAGAKAPYAVSPDDRFLVNQVLEASTTAPITILLNWKPKIK